MKKNKKKVWISATISKEIDDVVRQKAQDIYGGNYSKALEHIIAFYQSIWTDLMLRMIMTDINDLMEQIATR